MKADLVSVIMPVYNAERFIAQSIDSVLAQTYPHWELIVVDDGSTDGTAGIVVSYSDPRARCIHQENRGLAGARNTGIRAAQGKYLAFLDADDIWQPAFLERCVPVLRDDPGLAGVYTFNYYTDENGLQLPRIGGRTVLSNALHDQLLKGGFFPPCAVLVRSQIVHEVGLFDTRLKGQGTEDWDLWLRITQRYPMAHIAEPLTRYRVYPNSMSTNTGHMHANRIAVLAKHFGPPEGDPVAWSTEKRIGYAFAYRTTALGYIAQQETNEGWRFLRQAIETDPIILQRLDTFYELALGDQPLGYRGEAKLVDLERNGAEMLQRLSDLLASTDASMQAMRRSAFGNAYLALAMLHDQADDWPVARRYMRKAVKSSPSLLRSAAHRRRLLKLHAGQRLMQVLRPARCFINGAAS